MINLCAPKQWIVYFLCKRAYKFNKYSYMSGKIQAIKVYRSYTKSGLKEAKETIEKWFEQGKL